MLLELRVFSEQYLKGLITAGEFQLNIMLELSKQTVPLERIADDNMTALAERLCKIGEE